MKKVIKQLLSMIIVLTMIVSSLPLIDMVSYADNQHEVSMENETDNEEVIKDNLENEENDKETNKENQQSEEDSEKLSEDTQETEEGNEKLSKDVQETEENSEELSKDAQENGQDDEVQNEDITQKEINSEELQKDSQENEEDSKDKLENEDLLKVKSVDEIRKITDESEQETQGQDLDLIIEEIKNYYCEKKNEYNYLEAMTLKSLNVSDDIIQDKLKIEDLSFEIGNSSKDSTSKEYAKAIMGLISAGYDPTNFNGKDYVEFLANSQNEEGFFETEKDSSLDIEDVAYSIIALDMAGADYDVVKAINSLKSKFDIEGEKAFAKQWSFSSGGDLELTAISLIAFSNHKDIVGMNFIEKIINYIKSEQLECEMYGDTDYFSGKEQPSAKLTSEIIQALIAVEEDVSPKMINGLLSLKSGNKFKESKNTYGEYATSEVFAALTDVYIEDSMFKNIKVEVGEPSRVEIISPENKSEIKVGKSMQLSAKAYNKDGKYVALQDYVWSSNNTEIARIDKDTGVLTGVASGTATITAKIKGTNIEDTFEVTVVNVKYEDMDIKVDGDLSEIEVGKKVKISINVLDSDNEKIENPNIKLEISPKDLSSINERNILTALRPGNITITASIQNNGKEVLSKSIDLNIIERQQRIDKVLEEVKKGIINDEDISEYKYNTVMGLMLTDSSIDDVCSKAINYTKYFPNAEKKAKGIIMNVILGKNPEDCNGKNYVKEILNSDFYSERNIEVLANEIIALDTVEANYDESKAINALINRLTTTDNINQKSIALIALSNHKNLEGVDKAIEGIKKCFKEKQDEKGLIQDCQSHSLAIQALIACGEDIYSNEWTKEDEYGSEITLLDALLNLKEGSEFKPMLKSGYTKYEQKVYAFAALVDLSRNKSMYHEFKEVEPRKYTVNINTDLKDLALAQGSTLKLDINILENGNPVEKEVIWESLDNNIVKVENGVIKALKEGQTKVRVKVKFYEEFYDEINIKVSKVISKPSKVVIKGLEDTSIIKGDKFKLDADVLDDNGNILKDIKIKWISSNSNIASIDDNGNVTANGVGSVEINAQVENTDTKDTIKLYVFGNEKNANNTIDKFVEAIKDYYEDEYYRESQGNINAWETATFVRAGIDLDKWCVNKKYQPVYDTNINLFGSKVKQALIMLDIGENPTKFDDRNLIDEIIGELNKNDYGHADQNYLLGVIAVDKFNEKYEEQNITYNEDIVIDNILAAQTSEGGFKQRGDSPIALNTGYALKALSKHREYDSVNESINKAIDYLKSIQKDDGGFYTTSYITGYNAEVINGLIAVGEDLTSSKWTKGDKNPIESLFVLWKNNNSFDNKEKESENNRGWIEATQKALYTLVDLKKNGYSNYVVKTAKIFNKEQEIEQTCKVYTAIVIDNGNKYKIKSDPKQVTISTKKHKAGLTALGALQATTSLYKESQGYVTEIFGIKGEGTGGWLYTINDELPAEYADKATVKNGDKVVWYFSSKGMEAETPTWSEITGQQEDIKIKINSTSKTLKVDEKIQLTSKVYQGDKTLKDKQIKWSSSNPQIATINENGLVTAHSKGQATITASLTENENIKDTLKINVVSKEQGNKTNKQKIDEAIKKLRNYYSTKTEFTFRQALGYNYTSNKLEQDLQTIKSKYKINQDTNTASVYSGNIIGLIAAGENPYNHNGKNYVKLLADSQDEEGKFNVGGTDNYPTIVAYSILALDMAQAEYNIQNAIKALLNYQQENGSFGGIDETAMSITALSNHKDIKGVQSSISKALKYIKDNQKNSGGFEAFDEENPYSVSAVIQALISVGEDPLSKKWTKNNNSMLDSLLSFMKKDHFEYSTEWGTDKNMATEQAFIALADLYKGKSMFKQIKLNKSEPVSVQITKPTKNIIKEKSTLKLTANIYDKQQNIITTPKLIWETSNPEIAQIDNQGLVEAKKPGVVTIKVKIQGHEKISDTIELNIQPEEFEITRIGKQPIKKGTEAKIEINIKNKSKQDKQATFIVVLFDKNNNKMINYSYIKQTINAGKTKNMGAGFLVPKQGDYIIKALVWDNFQNQNILLGNPLTINIQ